MGIAVVSVSRELLEAWLFQLSLIGRIVLVEFPATLGPPYDCQVRLETEAIADGEAREAIAEVHVERRGLVATMQIELRLREPGMIP
mgnify:CR=1 FL=1